MINFFKPDDFDEVVFEYKDTLANIANEKLEREGKVVYANNMPDPCWIQSSDTNWEQKALLINIEKIKKCAHPLEKIKANDPNVIHGFICTCGANIKAIGFEEI